MKAAIEEADAENLKDPDVDELSHFILRLSYCQNEELRRWFLDKECALFQNRLESRSHDGRSLHKSLALTPISQEEKESMSKELQAFLSPREVFAKTEFYAVPFQQALTLVSSRQCFLKGGKAYVSESKVHSILTLKFRSHLSRILVQMSNLRKNQTIDPEKARIEPLLANMSRVLVDSEPSDHMAVHQMGGPLNASNLTQYKENMPLCMRQLHNGLVKDGKLKHWGRLQYGLFLKGAGLSMEEALGFFQRHFTAVTGEKFQKEYSYNIRHMYGKEGKRATYTAYNCSKIIMGNAPNAGDHHGCPFKHYDAQHLGTLLQSLRIGTPEERSEILALKKSNQFQLACAKHFEVMHPGSIKMDNVNQDNVGNHPNAWFRASVSYLEAKKGLTADVTP